MRVALTTRPREVWVAASGGNAEGSGSVFDADTVQIRTHLDLDQLERLAIAPGFAAIVRSGAVARTLRQVLLIGGDLTVAIADGTLIGYVTVHPVHPVVWEGRVYPRRWERLPVARELGSIEVSRHWRGRRIGERLARAAFADGAWEATIVLSEELSWHWDTEELHLTRREYRAMLGRLLGKVGFVEYKTDERNVASDSANMLMARIGAAVPPEAREHFRALLVTGEEI